LYQFRHLRHIVRKVRFFPGFSAFGARYLFRAHALHRVNQRLFPTILIARLRLYAMKLSPKSAGLLFALAQQIMGAVVPHDRPERMLGQAHSLLYHLFILFDTKHNLLFFAALSG
jgi:hypothetical protein